jgi:O-antigen ligase
MKTLNNMFNKIMKIENLFYFLSITFFFERIPSIETNLGPLRLYNIINTLIILSFIFIYFNNSKSLSRYTIPPILVYLGIFLIIGSFSIIKVTNVNRFIAAYASLIFCSLTTFFLAIARINYDKVLKLFIALFSFQVIFAAYQFVGDKYLALPPSITGVKELFQSNVFGIPRVHTTYNEPAYFANALFFGIFLFLFLTFSNFKISSIPNLKLFYILMTIIMFLLFWLTLAKSAWLILPIPLAAVLLLLFINLKSKIIQSIFTATIIFTLISLSFVILINPKIASSIGDQFLATIEGNTATSVERKAYSDAALTLIPFNLLTGIGPGQFGTIANTQIVDNLFPIDAGQGNSYSTLKPYYNFRSVTDTEKNITFNVYLEVLLEYGLLAFLVYLLFILLILKDSLVSFYNSKLRLDSKLILQLALCCYIICSLGQFLFISPVYINPFFVALGLLININHFDKTNQTDKV